jgi:hypothetical protein
MSVIHNDTAFDSTIEPWDLPHMNQRPNDSPGDPLGQPGGDHEPDDEYDTNDWIDQYPMLAAVIAVAAAAITVIVSMHFPGPWFQ